MPAVADASWNPLAQLLRGSLIAANSRKSASLPPKLERSGDHVWLSFDLHVGKLALHRLRRLDRRRYNELRFSAEAIGDLILPKTEETVEREPAKLKRSAQTVDRRDTVVRVPPSPQNDAQINRENTRPIFDGLPEGSLTGGFSVRRDESSEIFGLFLSAMEAGVAAMRTDLSLDTTVEFPAKLVRVLLFLLQHRGTAVAVGDLAEGLRVSLGWASRVADELALLGFVNRVRSERDRRVVHLELTEKAIKVAERLWSDHEAAIAAALGDLFPNERATVARFLRRLRTELEAPSKV